MLYIGNEKQLYEKDERMADTQTKIQLRVYTRDATPTSTSITRFLIEVEVSFQ